MIEEYRRSEQRAVTNRRKKNSEFQSILSFKIFRQFAVSLLLLTSICILRLSPLANKFITGVFTYTIDTSGITEALSRLINNK